MADKVQPDFCKLIRFTSGEQVALMVRINEDEDYELAIIGVMYGGQFDSAIQFDGDTKLKAFRALESLDLSLVEKMCKRFMGSLPDAHQLRDESNG